MLKVGVISSHNLKKKTGWDDLQLCDDAYLVLRDTNRDLEKRCVHFIDLNSKKFVYKIETISPLVQSIIFSCCTPSGLKIVGILGSGAIFCYDFLEKKYHSLQASLPAVFGTQAASSAKEEIAAFGASNDVSCVVIVSKSLQQYCFVDISKFGKNQVVSEQGNWAKCAFDRYPGKPHFNICFSEDEESDPNSFCVFVCQLHQDQIVLQKSIVKFTASNAESKIRSWHIPLKDRGQEMPATSSYSGVDVMCAVSLDHKCVAIVAQASHSGAPTNLYMCNTSNEKLGIIRKQIFQDAVCASRSSLVVAMEFSSDSNFLIVLTRLGEVSIFTLFGEHLLLHCEKLSETRSNSLPVIPPASSAQLATQQNFRVRAHWLVERRFVVTDGFQAVILEIETANPELSTAYEVAQGFLDHSEMMISNAADLAGSVSKELTPIKQKLLKRQSSETALNQTENPRILYRTQSLGNSNGSIPDLVKAYEAYLANIGSNDSILSVKSAKRRGTSLESVSENPVAQCLQYLDQALIGFAQTIGYYWKFSFQSTPFDNVNFLSCIESFFATVRKHCENFELDDKFESIYALQSHVACHFVVNLAFALFHSSPEASDESFNLFWKAAKIATSHLKSSVIEEPDKVFTSLLTNCLLSKVDQLLTCGGTPEVTHNIALYSERCLDLKELYITLCQYLATNGHMMNSTQCFDTKLYLIYLQQSLYQSGVNAKFLHTDPNPDVLAKYILDSNLGYKTQCSKIAKEYQKRYQAADSWNELSLKSMEVSPRKLENSSLTSLYLFLSKYDLEGVLQLIDTCISCFLAYENSLWPVNNNPELLASDKVQLFPFSFVDLITKDEGQLLFLPVVFSVSSEAASSRTREQKAESEEGRRLLLENRSKALRSVARIMGKYFLADQKLFIHPVHCAQEVFCLLHQDDVAQDLPTENRPRKVFLSRAKLTEQLNKLELTSVWTPQLAFSLLLVCGLYEEAAAFASRLGNDRITTAIHSAMHKLTDKKQQPRPLDLGTKLENLRQDLFNKIESRNNESFFKLDAIGGGLENYMSDLFQLGIICGIDLVPITVRECIQEIISSVSGFSLVIKEGVQLPLRPLFVTQNIDEECDETKLRNRLHNQLHLYRLCLHAANCDVLLVKHYLLALQKNLKKTEIQLPQTLVGKIRLSVDVNLLDDPIYRDVTKSFRACLLLLWLSHVRDQFNLALRAYNDLYSHVFSGSASEPGTSRESSNEGRHSSRSSRSVADLSQKWSDCIRWARLLIPFCKYMGEEVQLIDCLISLFMQVPLSEDNVSLLASVFCQPKKVEPRPNFDEEESFVFDSSHFALSHADYDLSSNEIVPFVLEKKYKKLMIKMRNAPNFETGEVFKHFVKQQRMRRSFIIQKGYENCELFVDSSEDLPEIGRLEFELSQEYVSFLEAAIDIMFTAHSSSTTTGDVSVSEDRRKQSHVTLNSTPVLLPYAKQVEKQLYAGSSSEQKGTDQGDSLFMAEKGKYVDDLMVPSMRHFLQQCISRKALGRQWRKHKRKHVSINQNSTQVQGKKMPEKVGLAALEATASSINTVVTEEKSFIETLSNNCSVMEDHFTLISAKEQISHAVLLSGDVFYNQRMDSQKFCIGWLSEWCGRSYPALSQITEQSQQVGGSLKLKITPNLLMNTCWNYTNSTNGWPFDHSANQQVYVTLPVTAQYHVEDLKIEESGVGLVSTHVTQARNEVDENSISARIGDGLAAERSNVSGFDEMDDSTLPSITASSRMSPVHLSPPRPRAVEGGGHSSRLSSARDSAGAALTDTEQMILETIKEPHLREEAHRRMLEAREAEMLQYSARESSASPRRKIVLSPESLRRLVRSETSQAIQKMMKSGDKHDASFQPFLLTQPPQGPHKAKDTHRHRKTDDNEYGYNVQFNLYDQQDGETSASFEPGFSEGPGYRTRDRRERDLDRKERHSRSRDKKRRHRGKRSKYVDLEPGYGSMAGQGHVVYHQRRVPQTVEIPLLQANTTNNMTLLRHQGELETDPYYLTGNDYSGGFLEPSEISMNGHSHTSFASRGTLQVHKNPDDPLTSDHLQNILPSSEELAVFLQSRRRKLEESKTSGRLQRLAWVTGEENKENGFSRQEQHCLFPPVNEDMKPKLLHLNVIAALSDEEVDNTSQAAPSPRVVKPHVAIEEPAASVTLKPILKDQQVGTDHEELKVKLLEIEDEKSDSEEKSVTVVTPEEQQIDLQSDLSFEVEDEDLLQNAATSPMPSPKKSEIDVQTVSVEDEGRSGKESGALTVSQIKQRVGTASNRAATTPEIFMNLHFPHLQNNNFISVADVTESTMADLPEVTSLYHPDGLHSTSYADLHWQIVKELREGPTVAKAPQSPERKDGETVKPRSPRKVAFATQDSSTSPLASPKKGSPRVMTNLSPEDVENMPDEFTVHTLTELDAKSGNNETPLPSNVYATKIVTPRTRGRTVNDQLATMAQQIEVMEDTSRRLMHELEGTHYLMNTVETMTNVIDPPPAAEEADDEQRGLYSPSSNLAHQQSYHSRSIIPSANQVTSPHRRESPTRVEESQKDETGDKPFMSGKDISNTSGFEATEVDATLDLPHASKPSISELDLREIFQNSLLSADVETAREDARKQEVRKWMKEKRKERMSNYIEHRRDLAQKEFHPWRQKNIVASSTLKENIKRREDSKTLRDNEFTEKRLESAKHLLGEMVHDQAPPTSRHPHPSTLSARTVSGASTSRSRTHSKLPLPAARATSKSRSRSRSHSQDPPSGYNSWYEYYRIQASSKLAARRRVAEEIKQEREEEEAELLSRLDELSQLSERSHPDYNSTAHEGQRETTADVESKPPPRPPPKLFTSLVKVQNPEATRSRTNSPHKSVTYQERLKQLQSSSGPLPKPSSSPVRAPVQTQAPGAIVASKKSETKPRVAKTYAERLKELQREKPDRTPSRSPAGRPSKTMMRSRDARKASPGSAIYSHTQQKWTTRQASPGTDSRRPPTEASAPGDGRSRTFSMGGRGRGYQRLALQRDRPYASPYREATDTELISGKAAKKSIQGGDAESGGVARDDVSEISDISAWSVPTKVKQLLQIDGGSENQEPAGTSKSAPRSFATSDSPRLTNIDFSEFDDMESQLSSKLDWDAVQQIIEDNEV